MADWKDTLNLPRTGFPMKANLPTTEPETLARWAGMDLYEKIRARREGAPKFVLQTGLPTPTARSTSAPRSTSC
jgi:isoleucyl-tRNA synthetase